MLWHQWRLHRIPHIAAITLLVLGFLLYAFYGSWVQQATSDPRSQVESLPLPGDCVVYTPAWAAQLSMPRLDPGALLEVPEVSYNSRAAILLYEDTFYTSHGLQSVSALDEWDLDEEAIALLALFPAGLPERGELLVPRSWTRSGYWAVGQSVTLSHDNIDGSFAELTLQVTGTYEEGFYLPSGLVIHPRDWQALTGYMRPNVMVLYQEDPDARSEEGAIDTPEGPIDRMDVAEAVRVRRRSTRFPSLPTPENTTEDARRSLGGLVLPFGFVIGQEVYTTSKSLDSLSRVQTNASMPLLPAVALMFVCLVMGVTVVTVILNVDHQRGLGIMKALGARPADVRGLYSRQFMLDFAIATVVGSILAFAGTEVLSRTFALPLGFPWAQSVLWVLMGIPLVWWGGQATAILFQNAGSLELLAREAQFDWWALLRFGGLGKQ